jgi:hypothetical protein
VVVVEQAVQGWLEVREDPGAEVREILQEELVYRDKVILEVRGQEF